MRLRPLGNLQRFSRPLAGFKGRRGGGRREGQQRIGEREERGREGWEGRGGTLEQGR